MIELATFNEHVELKKQHVQSDSSACNYMYRV